MTKRHLHNQCAHLCKDGTRCKNGSQHGKNLCHTHDPANEETLRISRAEGGRGGKTRDKLKRAPTIEGLPDRLDTVEALLMAGDVAIRGALADRRFADTAKLITTQLEMIAVREGDAAGADLSVMSDEELKELAAAFGVDN